MIRLSWSCLLLLVFWSCLVLMACGGDTTTPSPAGASDASGLMDMSMRADAAPTGEMEAAPDAAEVADLGPERPDGFVPPKVLCLEDERVVGGECEACGPGETNEAGDDPSGAASQCDPTVCGADQAVQANVCVACPRGMTNEAGDEASGVDTTCEPVLCEQDARVQSNACIKCGPGETNEAGDEASGADTACEDVCERSLGVSCAEFEQAYIKSSNTDADDYFGNSVVLEGDTLVVGAFGEASSATGVGGNQLDNSAPKSGAVYVFTRRGSSWSQSAYLKASNAGAEDRFGWSVALDRDTLAVGAIGEGGRAMGADKDPLDNSAPGSGAVYVFTRRGTDWIESAYLKASNAEANDSFGGAVALDGLTLVVGAQEEGGSAAGANGEPLDNSAPGSGAVYVFTRRGTDWIESAYLKASNAEFPNGFGSALALEGDTLAVGAYREVSSTTGTNGEPLDDSAPKSGAVYVFTRRGTSWSQSAYLKASNAEVDDLFGGELALSGDTLAVGAAGEDGGATGVDGDPLDNSSSGSGAVYVFTRSGTSWSQSAYLKASNAEAGDYFGLAVSLSGNTLAVGAYGEDSRAKGVGGNQLDNSLTFSGAVYMFTRSGTNWSQSAYLKASNTQSVDRFGGDVALDGDTLAIGADGEASSATGVGGNQLDNFMFGSGAVYVRKVAP